MSIHSDAGKGRKRSREKSVSQEEDPDSLEQGSSSGKLKKTEAAASSRTEASLNPPRTGNGVGDADEKSVTSEERLPQPFGGVSEVERKRALAEIGVRNVLAYGVVGFFLVCMSAYVVYMIVHADPEGLTNAISILVGIVGLVMGYFFGKEEGK